MIGPAWVAGTTRARLLSTRRLGRANARRLAGRRSIDDAIAELARTPYGREVRPGRSQAEAEWGVSQVTLWHLRVLAGWLPPSGAEMVRLLAGYWEIANVEDHLARLEGRSSSRPYELGTLATAWRRLAAARSRQGLRSALAGSTWGDPGGDDPPTLLCGMRLAWGVRVAQEIPAAEDWAAAWLLLVVARDLFASDDGVVRRVRPRLGPLGWDWPSASSLSDLARMSPRTASWVLEDIHEVPELWRAEARWWSRLESDGHAMMSQPRPGPKVVLGAIALLGTDAWRTKGALQIAARGGRPIEAFDALG
jgi:hypothetical protein